MSQTYKNSITFLFTALLLTSCKPGNDNALAYFNEITATYNRSNKTLRIYLDKRRATTDSSEKKIITNKIRDLLVNSIETTQNFRFSGKDFGFKQAVLEDYTQALKMCTQPPPRHYQQMESIDDQIQWLESFEKEQQAKTQKINENIRIRYTRFINHYKINMNSSKIK